MTSSNKRNFNCEAKLLTPAGAGGIAVISLIGNDANNLISATFHADHAGDFAPNKLKLGKLTTPEGEPIDYALICKTHTGFEVNIHGGPAVTAKTLATFADLGAKISQPITDCFTSTYADLNNPAIGKEIQQYLQGAITPLASFAVTNQWSGGLSKLANQAINQLLTSNEISPEILTELRNARERFSLIQKILTPAEVVLAGAPNAGKSTLTNLLTGRNVSIVHDLAGTTRDWVRELAIINGVAINLTDTAGLWKTEHKIDAEAVARAKIQISKADLVLVLSAGEKFDLPNWVEAKNILHISTKCDLHAPIKNSDIAVSCKDQTGIAKLKNSILCKLGLENFSPDLPTAFTARQYNLLKKITLANLQALLNG